MLEITEYHLLVRDCRTAEAYEWHDGRPRAPQISLAGNVLITSPYVLPSLQVVGLLDWPLTGHPDSMMGVIAHPGHIAAMAVSCDGHQLFTVGSDGVINAWEVRRYDTTYLYLYLHTACALLLLRLYVVLHDMLFWERVGFAWVTLWCGICKREAACATDLRDLSHLLDLIEHPFELIHSHWMPPASLAGAARGAGRQACGRAGRRRQQPHQRHAARQRRWRVGRGAGRRAAAGGPQGLLLLRAAAGAGKTLLI